MSFRLGLLFSRIRMEEKMLIQEAKNKNIDLVKIDSRKLIMGLSGNYNFDMLLEREVSHSRALYALNLFQGCGFKALNRYDVALLCGDKVATTKALEDANIPTPKSKVAFSRESAIQAIEEMGYPVVIKPAIGSWGRLLAKVNDRDSAESLLEHKEHLGSYYHSIFYIQEYIKKPGRDIRAFVFGNKTICAVYRSSLHWITNTSRGAKTSCCALTPEIIDLSEKASKAVGGGILAIDLMETDDGLLINEVNYTVEFRNSIQPTGVNIPEEIIKYVIEVVES
ncbi:MAG: lysine biosynthesis protein LysX [Candidatus Marinimicrobia bacterium]|nr:lysine biosynthesis protein LysX [Candidatus Neomarinimicrobiota bacterium]